MNEFEYDLVVIGTGPAGQKGAIAAAKARKRVAISDRTLMIGGVSTHTGTIPSKSIREAIFQLTRFAVKALYGDGPRSHGGISIQDVSSRVSTVVERETEVVRAQLTRNGIAIYQGDALFLDHHTVEVQDNGEKSRLKAEKILVACGTRPAHSPEIPFDNRRIVDTDHLSGLDGLPREVIVVGAGVVGLEYTSFMAALGAEVTLIDQRATVLEFVDRQVVEALSYHLRQFGVTFRLAEKVTRVEIDPVRERVVVELESGKKIQGDALIYAVGRQANGDLLNLEAAGLQADTRGRLKVNEFFQTDVKLLGVHVLGQRATEIIHIGQAVLFYGGSVEYFRDTIFNYPTLPKPTRWPL